jgi:hypothetical protein
MFNRNSTTPEIIKQAAERKKIQPRRGVLRIVSELSANRKSFGYFLFARHRLRTATIPASGFQRRFTEAIA